MKLLKYIQWGLILLSLIIFIISIILDILSFIYQGMIYSYYVEKFTMEFALQYKEKGVMFSEISNNILPIFIIVFIITTVFSIIRGLVVVIMKKTNAQSD